MKHFCPKGHTYNKTSACPVCPICAAAEKPSEGWLKGLSAPALRALQAAGIDSVEALHSYTVKELLALHGFGPSAIQRLIQNQVWPPENS